MPPPEHIQQASDLVTSMRNTRRGFLLQAKLKFRMASDIVRRISDDSRSLRAANGADLLENIMADDYLKELLRTAAGFSEKSKNILDPEEIDGTVRDFFRDINTLPVEEAIGSIVSRLLITNGDTLGGSLRNKIGARAGRRLTNQIRLALSDRGIATTPRYSDNQKVSSISYGQRLILFDKKCPLIGTRGKNIDVMLVRIEGQLPADEVAFDNYLRERLRNSVGYLAFGELKGGIDPAGADEHWKTASKAFTRIRARFEGNGNDPPKFFFVGAAIEEDMASELFDALVEDEIDYAANLTNPTHVSHLANWLVSL